MRNREMHLEHLLNESDVGEHKEKEQKPGKVLILRKEQPGKPWRTEVYTPVIPEARLGEPTPQSGSTIHKDTRGRIKGWWGTKKEDKRVGKPPANRPHFKTRFVRARKEAEQARGSMIE